MARMRKCTFFLALLVCSRALAGGYAAIDRGSFTITDGPGGGLSGLTYAGGTQYFGVVDGNATGGQFVPMSVTVDNFGAITSIQSSSSVVLGGPEQDLEGIAYNPTGNGGAGSVYVVDETLYEEVVYQGYTQTLTPKVREYGLNGAEIGSGWAVDSKYTACRVNRALESLAVSPNGQQMWTANEEALDLTYEGGPATTTNGTLVRLQQMHRNGQDWTLGAQTTQYGYVTQPFETTPPTGEQFNGLVDLAIMDDAEGTMLALERQINTDPVTGLPRIHHYLFSVDFSNATNIGGSSSLAGYLQRDGSYSYVPVDKTLIWESTDDLLSNAVNYEGIALGPKLSDGEQVVMLVSDGDTVVTPEGTLAFNEELRSIVLYEPGVQAPEPTLVLPLSLTALWLRRRRKTRR